MKVLEKVCFLLFLTNVDSRLKEQHRPCTFNSLCTCSSGGPDLGSVSCENIPFMTIPPHLNKFAIYIMSLKNNKLQYLEDYSLNGTGLWKLQINSNLLSDLPSNALAGLEKTLSVLDLSQNQLFRIPKEAILNSEKLSSLILSENHISILYNDDFRSIGKTLKLLDLTNNALMHIQTDSFRNMISLEVLNLAYNSILTIDDITFQSGLNNLKHLNLMGNQLQQIPLNALANLKNIKTVNLNDNMISTISEGRETRNRINLEELHLENNLLTELTPQSFRLFSHINRLFLKGNPLETVNDTFLITNVTEIYMPYCKISLITPNAFYSVAHSMQVVDLSFNNLGEFPDLPFTKLVRLSLAGNTIKEINFSSIKGYSNTLKYLDLRGPKMTSLDNEVILNLFNLREYLFNKKQSLLDKDYLRNFGSSIEKLSITKSFIKVIENGAFNKLSSLKELDLSYNSITKIENSTFKDNRHSLIKLNLHKAFKLTMFPFKIFNILNKLEYLDLSDNGLIQLPYESFISFQNLKYLNLNYNKLLDLHPNFINDINNPDVEHLKIAFNRISTLNSYTIRNLRKLIYLQMNDNHIKSIRKSAFLDLDSIIDIQLQGNLIENIENEAFQNLPNVQYINLAYNKLLSFNLEAFHQVGRLSALKVDVNNNNIQNLTGNYSVIHTSSNIKNINFSYNNISYIDNNYFDPIRQSVIRLDLSNNLIQDLSVSAFANMAQLQMLIISNNKIDSVDENEFKGITSLQILNLSFNNITVLPENLFNEQSRLRIFSASHNSMEELAENIFIKTNIEQLDLSYNFLEAFPQESLLTLKNSLQLLDLAGNLIQSLNFSNFKSFQNLRYLSLANNQLTITSSGETDYLPKLIYLDLSQNSINESPQWITEVLPDSLKILNLANTSLKDIPFLKSCDILFLNLSSNLLKTIKHEALENLQKIQVLDFSNNLLTTIHNDLWSNLPQLRSLYLQDNPIQALWNTTFSNMERLQQLFIKNIDIQEIQKDVFHPLIALQKLEISTYPQKDISISEMLSKNHGIKEIHLHVQENDLERMFDENLPKSLKKIILEGENLRHIDESRFSNIQSPDIFVDIRNSNITRISQNLFKSMKEVKNFTASFMNNKLQMIEKMYNPDEKQVNSKSLKYITLSENQLYCSCELSWIWEWIKDYEHENRCNENICDDAYIQNLRDTKCMNMNNRSLIDVFKVDLDCFSHGSAHNCISLPVSIILSSFVLHLFINLMLN